MSSLGAYLCKAFARPAPNPEAMRRVKHWIREELRLPPDTAFAVNEIVCTDPGCPGIETVILVMAPGVKTRAYKVQKALDEVTEQDIGEALAS
jgi:hypothetical protein